LVPLLPRNKWTRYLKTHQRTESIQLVKAYKDSRTYISVNMKIETLFSETEIRDRVKQIGEQISESYNEDDEIIIVCLLKGGFIFTADLVRQIKQNVRVEFMVVSSYGDAETSSGKIKIIKDMECEIQGKNVIIVDDIVDTGNTLYEILDIMKGRYPSRIETCCMLDKKEPRKRDVKLDYVGFDCPNKFVIGYGMDAANRYRNLSSICVKRS